MERGFLRQRRNLVFYIRPNSAMSIENSRQGFENRCITTKRRNLVYGAIIARGMAEMSEYPCRQGLLFRGGKVFCERKAVFAFGGFTATRPEVGVDNRSFGLYRQYGLKKGGFCITPDDIFVVSRIVRPSAK